MPDILRWGASLLARHRFGGQGTARPTFSADTIVGRLCQTPRRFTETPYTYFSIYGAMRSVSVSV